MCLAVPARVVEVLSENEVIVDFGGGVRRKVRTDLVDDTKVGEYLIVHVGYAIQKLDEEEAKETLELLNKLLDVI